MKTLLITLSIMLLLSISIQAQVSTCEGSTENYSVDTGTPPDGPNGTPGSTYDWQVTTAGFSGNITPMPNGFQNEIDIDWSNTPPGTYTLEVVETSADGCVGTPQTLDIIIHELPDVTNIAVSNPSACDGETESFVITGTPGAEVSYSLDGGATINTVVLDATTGEATVSVTLMGSDVSILVESITNLTTNCVENNPAVTSAIISVNLPPTTSPISQN